MDRRTFVTTVGITVASIGVAGCGESGPGAETTEEGGVGDDGDVGAGGGVGGTPGGESPVGGTPEDGAETTGDGVFGDETTTEGTGAETTGDGTGADGDDMVDGTPAEVETDTPEGGTETGTPGTETGTPGEGAGGETPGGTSTGGEGQDVSGVVGQIESGLQVEGHDFLASQDGGAVVGNILNRGRSTYSNIDLEVELYDTEGSTIDTMSASSEEEINDLAPQESWRFIVEYEGDLSEVAEYELNVTAESAGGGTGGNGTATTANGATGGD